MSNEDCAVTPISDLADRALEMMAQGGSLRVMDVPGDSSFASATFSGDVGAEIARRADLAPVAAPVLWTQAQQIAFARAYDTEDAAQRGEPTPWFDEEEEWVDYRLACVRAGLAALEPDAGVVAELVEVAKALSDAYRTWSLIPRRRAGEKQAFEQMHLRKVAMDAALAKLEAK